MTIPSTPRKAGPLLGNGVQTSWPFTFKVFADTDILVTVADNLGIETPLTLTSDYTVTLNSNQETSPGGAVTYLLPDGYTLVITGDIDYDQPLDLPSGGAFSPTALENELDRLTMQIQQLRETVNRAVQAPITSNASGYLPSPQSNALIGWNESETAMQNFPLSEIATAIAFATYRYDTFTGDGTTTSFVLSADPVTLGNIDVSVDGQTYVPGVDHTLVGQNLVFTVAPADGVEILARYGQGMASGVSGDALDISYQPAGVGAVLTTVEAKLKESKSAYDYGARGVDAVADKAAINAGISALHTAGGGYLIINEFISTSIDLTTLTNQTDVMLIDRRYKSAGHIAHFSTNGDMEYRIHGASVTGGEGPSWVSVNTATTGDRTSSLVSRYGTGIGSSVGMYMHMGVWDGSNWFPEFDMITNGASGFRSNLRVGYGTVGINTGLTGAFQYTQNKIFTVNKPPALGGGALYELSTTASTTFGDVKAAATNAAVRLAAAGGTNEWSLVSQLPSAGQLTIYDHNTTSNKLVFTSGGDTAITGVFRNAADNVSNLGSASYRWATVYAGTGAINTSDQNEKQDIQALSAAETLVAQDIKALMRRFRFKDAVTAKGDTARLHFGVMAQAVAAAFTAHGLNANDYALFCSDTWEEGGETKTRLGIRYDELLCFVIASL